MGSGEPSLAQPDPATLARWREVAEAFALPGRWLSSRPYGSGWINETLLVEREHDGRRTRWIQQRINARVFREPALVMEKGARDADRRALRLVPARDGLPAFVDADGEWWRTFHFIEGASSRDAVASAREAGAAAEAFGRFLAQLADLPGPRLHETIPHFHDARARFEQLVAAAKADAHGRLADCRLDFEFVLAREGMVARSEALRGRLPERVTHNDTKINNVLLDDATSEGVCVIDLDTVMPGLSLYDFGDLARRAASPVAEDERDLAKVRVDPRLFEALVAGYLRGAGAALVAAERDELVFASQLMTLLLGMRFMADHLAGDRYFRIRRPGQNLDLARTQLALLGDFERQRDALEAIVAKAAAASS
ncbi:MAG: Phosphotransferase enzyme family protein [Deltaproteobacteria bacterium]|nr:Phosphotransferase enzyme family protein [Deltaproteobacteria bacterium]